MLGSIAQRLSDAARASRRATPRCFVTQKLLHDSTERGLIPARPQLLTTRPLAGAISTAALQRLTWHVVTGDRACVWQHTRAWHTAVCLRQVGPPAVEATVASVNQKGGFGFANIDAAGAAKLGLGEHTRMSFHTAEVHTIRLPLVMSAIWSGHCAVLESARAGRAHMHVHPHRRCARSYPLLCCSVARGSRGLLVGALRVARSAEAGRAHAHVLPHRRGTAIITRSASLPTVWVQRCVSHAAGGGRRPTGLRQHSLHARHLIPATHLSV